MEIAGKQELHLGKRILNALKENENGVHQEEIVTGCSNTHGEVRSWSIRIAEAMRAKGIGLGDVVIVCPDDGRMEVSPILIACLYLGASPFCLAASMKSAEFENSVKNARPRIIICESRFLPTFANIVADLELPEVHMVTFDDQNGYKKEVMPISEMLNFPACEDNFKVNEFDPATTTAFTICSSGSTGFPKGVCLLHQGISQVADLTYAYILREKVDISKYSFLAYSGMYWISGIASFLMSCMFGFKKILTTKPFTPELNKVALKKYKPTFCLYTPGQIIELIKFEEFNKTDFSPLQWIVTGGSPISCETLDNFKTLLPSHIHVTLAYGMTEAGAVVCGSKEQRPGSCGKMLPWVKYKIVDVQTEKCLSAFEVGEIRVYAKHIFHKFINNQEETDKILDADGFLKTGDLAYYDEDGFVYIVDRLKEMIKYKGHQISPSEVEHVIRKIKGVKNVGVVGVRCNDGSDLPMAFVQLEEDSKITSQDIKDIVADTLSDSKTLRGGVVFLEKFPLTPTGKNDRGALNNMKATAVRE